MDVLLKMCGIRAAEAGHVTDSSLAFRGMHPLWVMLAGIVLLVGVWWMYRRAAADLPPARRIALTSLRGLFLVLILGLLLRPELTITFEDVVRRSVLLLVDDSGSMSIPDKRVNEDDRKRVAIARNQIDPGKGIEQRLDPSIANLTQVPRSEVVKAALTNEKINLIPRLAKNYDVSVFTFDKTLSEINAAEYRQKPRLRRALLDRMPWLLPGGLLLVGLAVLIAGAIGRAAWAKYLATATMAAAVLWGVIATARSRSAAAEQAAAPAIDAGDAPPQLDLSWVKDLPDDGRPTAIGDAVRDAIVRKGGDRLSAIVLVSDGVSNSGLHPLDAAKTAAGRKIPIYVYGVGASGMRDISIDARSGIFALPVALTKDKLLVSVRVRSVGMAGRSAPLVVKMGQEQVEQTVNLGADGEQIVTVELMPKGELKAGEEKTEQITAEIAPLDDEATRTDNRSSRPIKIKDGRLRVLYVEQSPRWEFRYIQEILRRQGPANDRRVLLKCLLLEGDRGIAADADKTIYVPEFPKEKKELFAYDVLVLGDVDPKFLSPPQIEMITEFVSQKGGGLVFLAGKRFNPSGYRGTPLEKLLPVELLATDGMTSASGAAADRPIRLELTPMGKESRVLKPTEEEAKNVPAWDQLPPIFWTARVGRAKPGAQVLVVDPDQAKAISQEKMPVIATQQYGVGPVLYIGTDNLWRWRRNKGERFHWLIWAQLTQRMARPHLLGAGKQVQLSCDQDSYEPNTPVTVYATLYSSGFEPLTDPTVKASCREVNGDKSTEVVLQAIPGHPGMYRGQFTPPTKGTYRFTVDLDKTVPLDVQVNDRDPEMHEAAMDRPLLEKVAATSGGLFVREEGLFALPEKLAARTEREKKIQPAEIWCSPMYFLLLMAAVTAEWVIRKMCQLK